MITKILIAFIMIYKLIFSSLWPSSCRFFPSCSSYSIQALEKYGFGKGLKLTILRVIKCHPFNPGGYDPLV